MAKNVNMMKQTGTHGAASAICSITAVSKIVDFIGAEPFGSAFFVTFID